MKHYSRLLGLILVAVGAWFVWSGISSEPRDGMSIVGGVLFIFAGILRAARNRPR